MKEFENLVATKNNVYAIVKEKKYKIVTTLKENKYCFLSKKTILKNCYIDFRSDGYINVFNETSQELIKNFLGN